MMTAKGLAKLIEECGELLQVAGKKLAYWNTDDHPDCAGSLDSRLEDEMADVIASVVFVAMTMELDQERIEDRADRKMALFMKWHVDPSNQLDNEGALN